MIFSSYSILIKKNALTTTVCVKKCPITENDILECSVNSIVKSCKGTPWKNLIKDNKNKDKDPKSLFTDPLYIYPTS